MELKSRRIARRIFLVHLLLLGGVLTLVYFASREVYYSARDQAIEQARVSQELLAAQSARGIENYYSTIISDLELLRRSESDSPATQPDLPALALARESAFYPFLWNQLNGRVSALFVYNRQAGNPEAAIRLLEPRDPVDQSALPSVVEETRLLATSARDWLQQVDRSSISRLFPLKPGSALRTSSPVGGVNLVAVPLSDGGPRVLVAVVPAAEVQSRFLPNSAERQNSSTTFIDDNLAVVASSTPAMVGTNLKEIDDPAIRKLIQDFTTKPQKQTLPFDLPITIAGATLDPRLITVEPVLMGGSTWCLLVSSPMSNVDAIVRDLFTTAVRWAAFVVISVTAILMSTAGQMIRSRLRLERVQHDVLTKEVSQARQIQLNWLPSRHSAGPAMDIAAINHPAHHISGDFYNWFDLPDGRQAIIIGDVTGHGMAAAFLMATAQMLVRTTMPRVTDPGACMEEVNRQLCTQVFHGQFVTMLIITLDLERGVAEVATAGHHPPLVSHGGGFEAVPLKSQLVLAVDETQRYPTERFELTPRSSLLLYTDGVVDVQNEKGDRFDPQGLARALSDRFDSAQAMIDSIVAAVTTFRGKRDLDDDLTMVAIQLQPVTPGTDLSPGADDRRVTMTV